MMNHEERITFFGSTDSRGKSTKFGIKSRDRTKHTYVIGKTGMGKSTLLENMAIQDIANGEGLAFIDPHGSTAEKLLEYIPEERIQDVLYFAPFDLEHPISFNVMENVEADKRHLVANGLMSVFEKTWEDQWSARMAYILNNTILALLEYPDATLLGINRMLADKAYRKKVVENITDPSVKSFWIEEFAGYSDRYAADATPAIQNKIGQYTSNSMMRNIIGQPKSSFDLREIMDTKKILIINLSKGRVGEGNANLLGSMLITKLYLAAMSRADVSQEAKENLPNFYLYVDEFQSFANRSFADILSEARKYKLNLTIAHQYIEQMSEEVRAAVFGNVGTMITFRIGAVDAEVFEKEYAPTFTAEDLVNLGFTQMYLKLMIDGVSSQPFSATSLPPIEATHASFKEKVMTFSREHYGKPRSLIEDNIKLWHEPIAPQHSQKSKPKATDTAKKSLQNKTELPPLTEAQLKETQKLNNKHSVNPNPQSQTGPRLVGLGPKPISLNNLKTTPKPAPKITKEPSKENKADLRNALASVMNSKDKNVSEQKEEKNLDYKPFSGAHGRPFKKWSDGNSNENSKNNPSAGGKEKITDETTAKKEVPKDVLENMLDVEGEDKQS